MLGRGHSAWDGGFFGVIGWSIPMLLGTIAYDVMAAVGREGTVGSLGPGILMVIGYALYCLATLYDIEKGSLAVLPGDIAASPVLPPLKNASGRSFDSLLATPPFMQPPPRHPAAMLLDDE